MHRFRYTVIAVALLSCAAAAQEAGPLGLFTNSADVGSPAIAGLTSFDPATGQYRLTGAGANMWANADEFQYVWREVAGNFTVTATMKFLGTGNAHRKAGIMVRQSLDTDATYADTIVHGDGMPAIQWRNRQGENTNTFDFPSQGPGAFTVKLVRAGVRIYFYLGKDGREMVELAHTEVAFRDPVLVGLAVCSHDAAAKDTVIFSDVSVVLAPPPPAKKEAASK